VSKEKIFFKSFIDFKEEFGFKELSGLLDRNNFSTRIVSNWKDDYVLSSVFQVKWVHKTPEFSAIHEDLDKQLNPNKKESNIDMFFSMSSGVSGPVHIDEEEGVHILQLHGIVIYKLKDGMYELSPGDMLKIPSGELHQAIGLTPRLTLSYGLFNK